MTLNDLHALVVSHRRASVEQISRLTERDPDHLRYRLEAAGAREAYVLHTCNRAEYYIIGPRTAREAVVEEISLPTDTIQRYTGTEAARHLLRVAAGLESMVVGEDEILGQVSQAKEDAGEALNGTLGPIVEKAIRVGKRVRSETRINEGNPSMGTAAAELASRRLGDLAGKRALVIGAGEMGKLVASPLSDRGVDLYVSNRTYDSAKDLAERVGATPVCFEAIHSHLPQVDLVVSATDAPHPILDEVVFREATVTVMDLATPPDVDPSVDELDSVVRFDIDDIGTIVDSAMKTRTEAAREAEEIVADELLSLERQFKKREAEDLLASIYEEAESIKREEVERARHRLEECERFSEREATILEDMSSAIVNKLLASATGSIKDAAVAEDYATLETIATIFDVPEATPSAGEKAPRSESEATTDREAEAATNGSGEGRPPETEPTDTR